MPINLHLPKTWECQEQLFLSQHLPPPKTTSPAPPILPFPSISECLEIIHGQKYGKVRTQKPSQKSDLKTKKHPSESSKAEG